MRAQILDSVSYCTDGSAAYGKSIHGAHPKDYTDPNLMFRMHLEPPYHGHWQYDNDGIRYQVRYSCIELESRHVSAMAAWNASIEAV